MRTRAKNALILGSAVVVLGGALALLGANRHAPDTALHAVDVIPAGALLVGVVDLAALRASRAGAPLLEHGREIPGLGKVRDVCGFDPLETLTELAFAVPAGGDEGEFAVVGSGPLDGTALVECAAKVIASRGGTPVRTTLGSFESVRDASLDGAVGEIAARKAGLVILSGGPYLRAVVDAADGRLPTVRTSAAHTKLAAELGASDARVTTVLTPQQRAGLAEELAAQGDAQAPGTTVAAGALGVRFGDRVHVEGVLLCDDAGACGALRGTLERLRRSQAEDYSLRLVGVGAALDRVELSVVDKTLHASVDLPAEEVQQLVERVLTLRGFRHPMPGERKPEPPADIPVLPPGHGVAPSAATPSTSGAPSAAAGASTGAAPRTSATPSASTRPPSGAGSPGASTPGQAATPSRP